MTATPARVVRLALGLLVASLPAVLWHDTMARAADLWSVAGIDAGLWVPGHAGLLLFAFPLVALSTAVLFLAPGLLLALLARRGHSVPVWLLSAVPFAVLVAAWIVTVLQWRLGPSPPGWLTGMASLELTAIAGAAVALASTRLTLPWPVTGRRDLMPVVFAVAALLVAVVGLGPKLLWESFNGDGAHAYEVSRLLLARPWPFFPTEAGVVAGFPGVTSMLFTWPNAWFLGLYGLVDVAVRLPFVIYLPMLVIALQAIAEEGRERLGGRTIVALWLGIVPFTLAMAYSASYEPYHADLALPGVQDLLLLVCIAGFIHAMVRRDRGWAILFGLMAHLALPNGLVLIGFWLMAECLVMRPWAWRGPAIAGLVVAACLLVSAALPPLIAATGHPAPGNEYGLRGIIAEVLTVNVREWRRLGWVLVGAGILPVLTLAWWRAQDDVARRITVVVVGYFCFFYVQARVSLHHFAPAMVLPLIVAARGRPSSGSVERRGHVWWLAAAAIAIVLAAPRSFAIATNTRTVGRTITQQVGDYQRSDPQVFAAGGLLSELFPPSWTGAVPKRAYGGSPLAWLRYAQSGSPTATTAYLLRPRAAGDSVPGRQPGSARAFTLVVLDSAMLREHQGLRPRTDTRSPFFQIPRATLFGPGGPGTVDLLATLRRLLGRS